MAAKDTEGSPELEAIKTDLAALRNDMSALTNKLGDYSRSRVRQAQSAGKKKVDDTREDIEEMRAELETQGRVQIQRLEDTIYERPFATLLTAFGLGMLISLFLGRRHG